jgi:iron-sulfur cluster repair protein YtfE (RIC family)
MPHECSCGHESSGDVGTVTRSPRPEDTVAEVVHHHAAALEILKQMGINHCCGAHLTLREAAAAAGVSLDALLAMLGEPRSAPA